MAIDTASNQIVETETLGRPLDALAAEALLSGGEAAAELVGLSPNAPLNQLAVTAGHDLRTAAASDGALLESSFAQRYGLHPGSLLRLRLGGRTLALRIRGLAQSPEYLWATANEDYLVPQKGSLAVLWLPLGTLQRLAGAGDRVNDLAVDLPGGGSGARAQALAAGLPVARATPRDQQFGLRLTDADIHSFSIFAPVMGAVFAIVGVMLIALSLHRLVNAQRRELGALLALGYPPRIVIATVLVPAAWLATVGALRRQADRGRVCACGRFPDRRPPARSRTARARRRSGCRRHPARRALARLAPGAARPDRGAARRANWLLRAASLAGARDRDRPCGADLRAARTGSPPAAERRNRAQHRRRDRARGVAQHHCQLDQRRRRRRVRPPGLELLRRPRLPAPGAPRGRARKACRRPPGRAGRHGACPPTRTPRPQRRRATRRTAAAPPAAPTPAHRRLAATRRTDRSQPADRPGPPRRARRSGPAGDHHRHHPCDRRRHRPNPRRRAELPPQLPSGPTAGTRRPRHRPTAHKRPARSSTPTRQPADRARQLQGLRAPGRARHDRRANRADHPARDDQPRRRRGLPDLDARALPPRPPRRVRHPALGYGRRQLGVAITGEAVAQTALAAALSIPLGILIASPLSQQITKAWFAIGLTASPPSFLLVIAPALALALLAALHATHRALRIDIAAAVRARLIG